MKKLYGLAVLWLGVIAGFPAMSHAAQTCAKTDFLCFETGPSQNLATPFRVDSAGNITSTGNETLTGNQTITGNNSVTGTSIFPATSQVSISTLTSITPTATFITLLSTGATVNFQPTTPAGAVVVPAISTSTAVNGQEIVLFSTTSVSNITISTGTGSAVIGDDTLITISATKSAVRFIYSSTLSQWIEEAKQ